MRVNARRKDELAGGREDKVATGRVSRLARSSCQRAVSPEWRQAQQRDLRSSKRSSPGPAVGISSSSWLQRACDSPLTLLTSLPLLLLRLSCALSISLGSALPSSLPTTSPSSSLSSSSTSGSASKTPSSARALPFPPTRSSRLSNPLLASLSASCSARAGGERVGGEMEARLVERRRC